MKNIQAIDLNLLKVLVSVYHHRNLTKAGEKIGLSQPAVSRSLERLNHIYGERLFIRSDGEMKPSSTTKSIISNIEEALYLIDSAVNIKSDFDPKTFNSTIKIGLNDYCLLTFAPDIIARLKRKSPNLKISIVPANYQDAPTLIDKGEIDCAIVSSIEASHSLCSSPLFDEDYVVILNPNYHKEITNLDLGQYLNADHLLVSYKGSHHGWVDQELKKMGSVRNVHISLYSFSAVPNILSNSSLLCTIPRRLSDIFTEKHNFKSFELPFTGKTHRFYFIRKKQLKNNIIANWLKSEIISVTSEFSS